MAAEIAALGRRAAFVQTDVTQAEQVAAMVAAAERELGGLDIAVNNAWAGGRFLANPPAEEFPDEDWDFVMGLALRAIYLCCKAEAKAMRKRGPGEDRQHGLHVGPDRQRRESPTARPRRGW